MQNQVYNGDNFENLVWKYNDKPFSGKIEIELTENNIKISKAKKNHIIISANLTTTPYDCFFFLLGESKNIMQSEQFPQKKRPTRILGELKNGKISGKWKFYNDGNELIYDCTLLIGKLMGDTYIMGYPYSGKNEYYIEDTIFWHYPKKQSYYRNEFNPLTNGVLNGTFYNFNYRGDTLYSCNYQNNKKNGLEKWKSANNGKYTFRTKIT